jgi:hypothetical protein
MAPQTSNRAPNTNLITLLNLGCKNTYLSAKLIANEEPVFDFNHANDIIVHEGRRRAAS